MRKQDSVKRAWNKIDLVQTLMSPSWFRAGDWPCSGVIWDWASMLLTLAGRISRTSENERAKANFIQGEKKGLGLVFLETGSELEPETGGRHLLPHWLQVSQGSAV